MESNSGADSRIKDLKRQLEKGQEDVYKIEKERDELAVKVEELEKTLEESSTRESELQVLADQARQLKDEVDILRETADKVDKVRTLKNKPENPFQTMILQIFMISKKKLEMYIF